LPDGASNDTWHTGWNIYTRTLAAPSSLQRTLRHSRRQHWRAVLMQGTRALLGMLANAKLSKLVVQRLRITRASAGRLGSATTSSHQDTDKRSPLSPIRGFARCLSGCWLSRYAELNELRGRPRFQGSRLCASEKRVAAVRSGRLSSSNMSASFGLLINRFARRRPDRATAHAVAPRAICRHARQARAGRWALCSICGLLRSVFLRASSILKPPQSRRLPRGFSPHAARSERIDRCGVRSQRMVRPGHAARLVCEAAAKTHAGADRRAVVLQWNAATKLRRGRREGGGGQ